MTGNIQEFNPSLTRGTLFLIFPFALVMVIIIKAWLWVVLLIGLVIGWKFWQKHQWQQLTSEVNPFFKQLIKENQGCLTVLDLSLKADLTAKVARRFLEGKAEEYGAQRQVYEDQQDIVYCFLTASALGSIFDASEPLLEQSVGQEQIDSLPQFSYSTTPVGQKYPQSYPHDIAKLVGLERSEQNSTLNKVASKQTAPLTKVEDKSESSVVAELVEFEKQKPNLTEEKESADSEEVQQEVATKNISPLIQTELAKRLDVHASTVGKHKSLPDFPQWSQSHDPEGIGWKYLPKTKMFVPVSNY